MKNACKVELFKFNNNENKHRWHI